MLSGVTKTGGSSNRLLQITHADKVRSSKTTRQFRVTLSAHGFEDGFGGAGIVINGLFSCLSR